MKYIISVLFSCFVMLSFAQVSLSKWSIGVNASAGVGYRFFSNTSQVNQSFIDDRNEIESPVLTYGGGLFTEWAVHEKMTVSFGVHYSKYGLKIKFDSYFIDQQSNVQFIERNYIYGFHKIGIPLSFKYQYYKKEKITLFAGLGFDMDFFFMESIKIDYPNDPSLNSMNNQIIKANNSNLSYNIVSPGVNISMGIDVSFGRSKLRIEPIYKLVIGRVEKSVGLRTNLYKGGINFAYLYNF